MKKGRKVSLSFSNFFLFQSSSILVQITFIFSFLVYFSNCSSDNGYPNPNSQHWNTLIIIPAPLSFGRIGRVLLSPTHHLFVNWYCLNMRLLWPRAINGLVPTGILTLTYLPNTTLLSISWTLLCRNQHGTWPLIHQREDCWRNSHKRWEICIFPSTLELVLL